MVVTIPGVAVERLVMAGICPSLPTSVVGVGQISAITGFFAAAPGIVEIIVGGVRHHSGGIGHM